MYVPNHVRVVAQGEAIKDALMTLRHVEALKPATKRALLRAEGTGRGDFPRGREAGGDEGPLFWKLERNFHATKGAASDSVVMCG